MTAPRIVVVGSINVDMVVKGPRLPGVGETVTGGRFAMVLGGKGANQAVAAARLGAQVTLIGRIGQDLFGEQALAAFRQEGIVTDWIIAEAGQATGVALILVDDQGRNVISVASGANHALLPQDIEKAAGCIASADIVLLQLEVPLETVRWIVQRASAAGVAVLLDPAPAAPLDEALLRGVAYLKPNETEAEQLTGVKVLDTVSAYHAGQVLLQRGARRVVITLGAKGAVWLDPPQMGFVPAVPVDPVDSTAAGDAFSGGLACALANGRSLAEAVAYGNLVGALSVTRFGAQSSLPTADEVQRFAQEKGRSSLVL